MLPGVLVLPEVLVLPGFWRYSNRSTVSLSIAYLQDENLVGSKSGLVGEVSVAGLRLMHCCSPPAC